MKSVSNNFYAYQVSIQWSPKQRQICMSPFYVFYSSNPIRIRNQVLKFITDIRKSFVKIGYKERYEQNPATFSIYISLDIYSRKPDRNYLKYLKIDKLPKIEARKDITQIINSTVWTEEDLDLLTNYHNSKSKINPDNFAVFISGARKTNLKLGQEELSLFMTNKFHVSQKKVEIRSGQIFTIIDPSFIPDKSSTDNIKLKRK